MNDKQDNVAEFKKLRTHLDERLLAQQLAMTKKLDASMAEL
jgi:hypothetical protein